MAKSLTVTLPNGSTHTYDDVPDNVTQEQAQERANKEFASVASEPSKIGVGTMLSGAMFNAPSSAVQFAKDIAQPVIHPLDTAESAIKLGLSALNKIGVGNADPALANQVGQYFANRYGGVDNAMRTFSEDPFGMLSDTAALLKGAALWRAKFQKWVGLLVRLQALAPR